MWNEQEVIRAAQTTDNITSFVDLKNRRYTKNNLEFPGVYCFWLMNHDKTAKNLKRDVIIQGPNNCAQKIHWDWNLDEEMICLYVGKSTNIKHRLGLHLLLRTSNLYQEPMDSLNKITTSCQLRSGFDYLYQVQQNSNMIDVMSKRLMFSCFREDDFVKRFFIEDYLVGKLLPWFNVDSER